MNSDLIQAIIDLVFKGYLLYLSPLIFLLMVVIFADSLIGLIVNAVSNNKRNRY